LGDSRCRVDLAAVGLYGSGAVAQVLGAFDFTASGLRALATGVLTRGKLTWNSGANVGLGVEVKAHTQGTGSSRLSLFLPMPEPIAVGDAFAVTAGCDKALATCRDRFSNVVNFGGFPHMPGNDFALSYPNTGDDNDGGKLT
jgi:uncharacterized phage protein (TIGR02218 family)